MTWRVLSQHDGVTVSFAYDWQEDRTVIRSTQDPTGAIERNKAAQNEAPNRDEVWRHAASIPLVIWEQWLQEGMPRYDRHEQQKFIARKLQDPDYRYLKTQHGRSPYWLGVAKPRTQKLYFPDGTVKSL